MAHNDTERAAGEIIRKSATPIPAESNKRISGVERPNMESFDGVTLLCVTHVYREDLKADEVCHVLAANGKKYVLQQLLKPGEPFTQVHQLHVRLACRRLSKSPPP